MANLSGWRFLDDAYNLCEEASFVTDFLRNEERRDELLSELPRSGEKSYTLDMFVRNTSWKLEIFNEKKLLTDEKINNIIELIENFFPNDNYLKKDKKSAFYVISMAVIYWIIDIERGTMGVVLFAPKKK